jgi:hypothetical protein
MLKKEFGFRREDINGTKTTRNKRKRLNEVKTYSKSNLLAPNKIVMINYQPV